VTNQNIEIIEVSSKQLLKEFIRLPSRIHKNHHNWVPPIYMDEKEYFNPKKNESFSFSDTILLLAIQNGEYVGRIMGIINHKYNNQSNEKDARFCFLETFDDYKVAEMLLNTIEKWAAELQMTSLVGPLGFTDKDPQGFLVEGFDEPSVIATTCNFPYMSEFIETYGFDKKTDLVVYHVIVPDEIPEFYKKVHQRTLNNNKELNLINFKSKKQLKPYIRPILTLMNETFKDIYAFSPLTEKEMDEFAGRYLMVLDPKFIKAIENDKQELIAFIIGMPDISDGIRKSKGKLFPFGFIKILRSQKKTKQLNLLLGGIREDYRNKGLNTLLGVEMLNSAKERGLEYIDSHLELEDNLKMRAEMERMGGKVYKRYRIFTKPISL
jgi:hypothetical protein